MHKNDLINRWNDAGGGQYKGREDAQSGQRMIKGHSKGLLTKSCIEHDCSQRAALNTVKNSPTLLHIPFHTTVPPHVFFNTCKCCED